MYSLLVARSQRTHCRYESKKMSSKHSGTAFVCELEPTELRWKKNPHLVHQLFHMKHVGDGTKKNHIFNKRRRDLRPHPALCVDFTLPDDLRGFSHVGINRYRACNAEGYDVKLLCRFVNINRLIERLAEQHSRLAGYKFINATRGFPSTAGEKHPRLHLQTFEGKLKKIFYWISRKHGLIVE